jgi:hypothetical protein
MPCPSTGRKEESLSENKVFNLDDMPDLWLQYVGKKKEQKTLKQWVEQFGDALKKLSGEASELRLGGRKVATIVAGQLNKTLLAKEQPDIIDECTVTMTVVRFDEALFKQKYPDMFKQYQAQRLVLTGETE